MRVDSTSHHTTGHINIPGVHLMQQASVDKRQRSFGSETTRKVLGRTGRVSNMCVLRHLDGYFHPSTSSTPPVAVMVPHVGDELCCHKLQERCTSQTQQKQGDVATQSSNCNRQSCNADRNEHAGNKYHTGTRPYGLLLHTLGTVRQVFKTRGNGAWRKAARFEWPLHLWRDAPTK